MLPLAKNWTFTIRNFHTGDVTGPPKIRTVLGELGRIVNVRVEEDPTVYAVADKTFTSRKHFFVTMAPPPSEALGIA